MIEPNHVQNPMRDFTVDSLRLMAVIAEHSLQNISQHLRRIREYAFLVAEETGMTSEEAATLADACLLHDVGMVSVPSSIVRKATNLSNEEWELVRQHPIIGAQILRSGEHKIFRLAETIAMTHHERWDGSGYPNGLKEDEIPLAGRICGICDVFDTLTHPRAYKRALAPDEVLLLLQESSGSFFDPKLVEVFTLKYPQILQVREVYPN